MNEIIPISNEVTMTSVEVVELINQFREVEGKSAKRHYDFKKSIDAELNTLESLGLANERNISFVNSTYEDAKSEMRPCYLMNRNAILFMLNKESTFVRYKTIQYIDALENRIHHQELLKTVEVQQVQIQELQKLIGLRSKRTFDYVKYIKDCLGIKKVNAEYKRVKQRLFYEFNVSKFEELTYSDEVLNRIEDIVRQIKEPTLYKEGTQIGNVFNSYIQNLGGR